MTASRLFPAIALVSVFAGITPSPASAQTSAFEFTIEAGPVWQSYNDVEIPNDGSATRFDLAELAGAGPWRAGRVYLTWNVSEGHALRLLAAPLTVTATGTPATPLTFSGSSFVAGTPAEATYTFNSYRLSYRWRFHAGDRSAAWLGFTAKVRDASIGLVQGSTASRKDDLGFVPLLHLAADRRIAERWHFSVDVDGLAGGPGRAVDGALKLGYSVNDRWAVEGGYRTVEGGADVASVYNFTWLHFAVLSVVLRP